MSESYFSISAAEPFRYVARRRLFPRYYGTFFFPHRQRIIINPFGRSRLQRRKNQQQHHRAAQNRHRNVFSAKSRSTYRLRRNLRNSHRYLMRYVYCNVHTFFLFLGTFLFSIQIYSKSLISPLIK